MAKARNVVMEVRVEELRMKEVFRISGYDFTGMPAVIVTLTAGEHVGRGEASGVYYIGDGVDEMLVAIEAARQPIENGATRRDINALMPPGGGRNAIDCALWDLDAARTGRPVWKLAGLDLPRPLTTTFTVGADIPETMAAAAKAYTHAKKLKLKLTGEPELDGERVTAVRAARPECWIMVDANQGYSRSTLDAVLPSLIAADVSLIEQPLPRGSESDLRDYSCCIPLAADESVLSSADLDQLKGVFNYVNIKLDKCGGLTEGLAMASAARSMGFGLMIGNMLGSSWAIAPAFLVGQQCDIVDLDGPSFLARDRERGVVYTNGQIDCEFTAWGK